MKVIRILPLLAAFLLTLPHAAVGASPQEELRSLMADYVRGWREGDAELLSRVFDLDEGRVHWVSGEGVEEVARSMTFREAVERGKRHPSYGADGWKIASLDVVGGELATVKLEISLEEGTTVDHLVCYKVAGRWRIVSKTFRYLPSESPLPPAARPEQGPQPREAPFLVEEYEPYRLPGTGAIEGQAFLWDDDGDLVIGAGKLVFMNPVTTYSTEWWERNVMRQITLSLGDPRARHYHWITMADGSGRFRIEGLPAGEYYLGSRVIEGEKFAYAKVALEEGETAHVLLTHGPAAGRAGRSRGPRHNPIAAPDGQPLVSQELEWRDSTGAAGDFGRLNPGAPPETEQWGRLAGEWDCVVATPSEDGSISRRAAAWTWSYTLDGNAIQDHYAGSSSDGRPPFRGTALRAYNANLNRWEIAWADTSKQGERPHRLHRYTATYEAGALTMADPARPEWSTVFFNMREDSFEWRNEPSGQTMRCERITAPRG